MNIHIYLLARNVEKKDNRVSSFPYSAIATNYEKIGNFDEAIKYQLKGIKLEEKLTGKDSLEVANLTSALCSPVAGLKT